MKVKENWRELELKIDFLYRQKRKTKKRIMNTHAEITHKNNSQLLTHNTVRQLRNNEPTCRFIDNRPETILQRKIQDLVKHRNHSSNFTLSASDTSPIQMEPMALTPDKMKLEDAASWTIERKKKWVKFWEENRNLENYRRDTNKFDVSNRTYQIFNKEITHADKMVNDPTYAALVEFDNGNEKIGIDQEAVNAAICIIQKLADIKREDLYIKIDPIKAANELTEMLANPELMDQKGYPLCGPDTLMRTIAIKQPVAYAIYVTDLFIKGKGRLGNKVIEVPDSVKDKKFLIKDLKITDWVATASIRLQNNKGYKIRSDRNKSFPKKWHSSLGGATGIGTMKQWLLDMGVTETEISSATRWVSKATREDIQLINSKVAEGRAVALAINPNIMGNKVDTEVPKSVLYNHFVTLCGPIKPIKNNFIANILTYGKTNRIIFQDKPDEISKSIKGYLAYDLSKLAVDESSESE